MQSEIEDVAAAMLKMLKEWGSDKQNRLVLNAYQKAISYKWEETAEKLFSAFQ
jgi:hypothetical protein